jgi:hypothetical protein
MWAAARLCVVKVNSLSIGSFMSSQFIGSFMSSQFPSAIEPLLQVVNDPCQGCVWEVTTPGTWARFSCGEEARRYMEELRHLSAPAR